MKLNYNLRPCMVASCKNGMVAIRNDGKVQDERKALFHCWNQWSDVIGDSILRGGHKGGQIADTYGIVEFEDGTVENVYPQLIRFLDNPFTEYIWDEGDTK